MEYYITTLTTAFKNLGPYIAFFVGGYFIFIKMPFLFFKKSMDNQKKKIHEEANDLKVTHEEKYTVDDYLAFQRKLKFMNGTQEKSSEKKKEEPRQEKKTEQKTEEKREKKQEQKREIPKPSQEVRSQSPEEIFGLKTGEVISKSELKKIYFELLKKNHPDRVASMGQDFKKLAEKNTKEINRAYDKLKVKAA